MVPVHSLKVSIFIIHIYKLRNIFCLRLFNISTPERTHGSRGFKQTKSSAFYYMLLLWYRSIYG